MAKKDLKEMTEDLYLRGDGAAARTITIGRQDSAQDVVLVDTELTVKAKAGGTGRIIVATDETTIVDGDKIGRIDFQAPSEADGGDSILVGAAIWAEADAMFSATVNSTELVFATGASEAATEKMRLTSNGKLGIGTAAPDTLFELTLAGVEGGSAGIALWADEGDDNADKWAVWVGSDGKFYISDYSTGSYVADLTIDGSNGRVGIGTSTPTQMLDVNGNVKGTYLVASGGVIYTDDVTGNNFIQTTGGNTSFYDGAVQSLVLDNNKVGVGTATFPSGGGSKVLIFGDATSDPTGMPANHGGIYAKAGEVYCIDSGDNATLQTPHPQDAPADFYEEPGGYENILKTIRYRQGQVIWVHQERPIGSVKPVKLVETFAEYNTRTGESLVQVDGQALIDQWTSEYQEKYTVWLAKAKQRQALLSAGRYMLAGMVTVPERPITPNFLT